MALQKQTFDYRHKSKNIWAILAQSQPVKQGMKYKRLKFTTVQNQIVIFIFKYSN